MPGIFISYRRDDSAYIAVAINEKFQQRFGEAHVFFDIDTIPLGVDFRDHIGGAVGGCDALLVVIGDQWLNAKDDAGELRLRQTTDYVRVEIESALQRNVPVVPVLVGNAMMPTESQLPESIRALAFRNAAEVRAGRDLNEHVERLVRDVGKVAGIEPAQPVGPSGTVQTDEAERDATRSTVPSADSDSTFVTNTTDTRATASPTKSKTPVIAGALLLVIVVGLGIAFAAGLFQSGPADGPRSSDQKPYTGRDQLAKKDTVKPDPPHTKDGQKQVQLKDTAAKDSAVKDAPVKDASIKSTATKDDSKQSPGQLDRSNARETAVAVLHAYKAEDYKVLATFIRAGTKNPQLAEIAETGERFTGSEFFMSGWRADAVKSWTGNLEAPRYEKRASDAGLIKAVVRFEQKSLNPTVVVAMYLKDGKWEFEDIESPPEIVYKRMSTELPN